MSRDDCCVKVDYRTPHDSGIYVKVEQVVDLKKARAGSYELGFQLTIPDNPPMHIKVDPCNRIDGSTRMLVDYPVGLNSTVEVPKSVRNRFKFTLHAVYVGIPAVEGQWDNTSKTFANPEFRDWYDQVKGKISAQELQLLQQPNEACVVLSSEDREAWTCRIKIVSVSDFADGRPISRKVVERSDDSKKIMWKALHSLGRTGAYCPIRFNSETFAVTCCSQIRLISVGGCGWSQQGDYLSVEMLPYMGECVTLGVSLAGTAAVSAAAGTSLLATNETVVRKVVTRVPGILWGTVKKASWVPTTRAMTVTEALGAYAPSIALGAAVTATGVCLGANYVIRQAQIKRARSMLDHELKGMDSKTQAEQDKEEQTMKEKRQSREKQVKRLRISIDKLNFAFCGETGVGKSTCINAVLQRDTVTDFLAAISNLGEGTLEIERHEDALFTLFDVPGAGTQRHPANTYFEDKALDCFDGVMVFIQAARQKESDIELIARLLFENEKRVAVVCGRVNQSIQELSPNDPEKAIGEIRAALLDPDNERSLKSKVECELRETYSSQVKFTEESLFLIDQQSWMLENQCRYDESRLYAWMLRCKYRSASDQLINQILEGRNMPAITAVLTFKNHSSFFQQLRISSLRKILRWIEVICTTIRQQFVWR